MPGRLQPGRRILGKAIYRHLHGRRAEGYEENIDEMLDHDERWKEKTLDVSPKEAIGDKKRKRLRTKHFFPKRPTAVDIRRRTGTAAQFRCRHSKGVGSAEGRKPL